MKKISSVVVFHPLHSADMAASERPGPDFVVSRRADGEVASRYGDLSWDWTPYVPSGKHRALNFQFWPSSRAPTAQEQALLTEMHWLMYLLAWRRQGPTLSYQSLLHYVKTLRAVSQYCSEHAVSLQEVFSQHELALDVVNALPAVHVRHVPALVSALARLGPTEVGYTTAGARTSKVLQTLAREYGDALRQHPPLPTRVYSHVITTLTGELADFELVADRYFGLVRRCIANPLLGRSKAIQWKNALALGIEREGYVEDFRSLLAEHGLEDYFRDKKLGVGSKGPSVKALSVGLTRLQAACRLTLQVFSGMRDEEAAQLPYECLQVDSQGGKRHFFLDGTTTKLNNGKAKAAKWVTSSEGARAVALAQRIAQLCYETADSAADEDTPLSDRLLFPSIANLNLAGRATRASDGRLHSSKFDFSKYPDLRVELQPSIEDADICELERIDPHRAWRTEPKFQVGEPWTLTTHQLRRSLALYAQRSGLVSLPSLRRQLQHLTEEMSRYYARGSAFADSLIAEDKEHFGAEWREMQPVSSALSYIFNVLTTDDVLFGAHGNWVEHRLRGEDGTVLLDREATIKRFKKGELAYKETLLGGCTSTERCDIQPIKWLNVDCVKGCKNMVGRASKLDRVIAAQARLVERLTPDSIEHRTEHADLQVLLHARQRIQERLTEPSSK